MREGIRLQVSLLTEASVPTSEWTTWPWAILRLELFAGAGGVEREIRWAHVSELPDPSEWLERGALVMTTGLGLPEAQEAQAAYVERLARAELGGLLFVTTGIQRRRSCRVASTSRGRLFATYWVPSSTTTPTATPGS